MNIIELLTNEQKNNINKLVKSYSKNNEFEASIFSNKNTCNDLLTLIPSGIIKLSHLNKMTDNVQYRKELLKSAIKTFKRREVNIFYINDI